MSGRKSNDESIYTLHELTDNEQCRNDQERSFKPSGKNLQIRTYDPENDNFTEIYVSRDTRGNPVNSKVFETGPKQSSHPYSKNNTSHIYPTKNSILNTPSQLNNLH